MIPFEQALEIVLGNSSRLDTERVPLAEASGRMLAENVLGDMDFPPFDKACMDGFACRREDLGRELEIVETLPAGVPPEREVGPGQAARIMTGAVVPIGADVVFMVEFSREQPPGRVRFTGTETQNNIAYCGEDLEAGDPIMPKGTWLEPRHVGVLASAGCVNPLVSVRPLVGIIATGSELVEPDLKPGLGQIRNSNAHQFVAQAQRAGAVANYFGIAEDTREATDLVLGEALERSDIVLLSGGVSMGDFDFVPDSMRANGLEILFDRVAMKPGKPITFARGDSGFCFGMPGNPVSGFVGFEVFVRPFMWRMMGHTGSIPHLERDLSGGFSRRKTDRLEWVQVRFDGQGGVRPVEYHGSAHLAAMVQADGMMKVDVGVGKLDAGAKVHVRPL